VKVAAAQFCTHRQTGVVEQVKRRSALRSEAAAFDD
jgi:hypothetical protein